MRCQTFVIAFAMFSQHFATSVHASNSVFSPKQDQLPVQAPADAVVLFDGPVNEFLSMSGGNIDWPVDDGCLISTRKGTRVNHIVSRYHFRDAEIHVEFMVSSKGRGNSGVYLHGHYELQIYDSFGNNDVSDQAEGALYGFSEPLVNASRPPGTWQVYDIRYVAPRRDDSGKITEQGKITAWLNGQLVQANTCFEEPKSTYHPFRYGSTPYLQTIAKRLQQTSVGPVFLQDHDSPTRFRNIWIRPLDDQAYFYEPTKE